MNKQQEPHLRFKGFTKVWQEKVLGEFVKSLDAGVSVNSEDILPDSDELSVLKTSCLSSGIFDKNERKRVLSQTEIKRLKEELKDNSILMSRMNTPNLVGLSAYIEKAPKNTFLPDRLWQLKINNEQASTEWLAYYLSKPENLFRIQDNATGTSNSMKNITKNDVFQFEILAPSLPEQTHLGNFFRRLDSQIAESRAVLEKSRQLKKAMLAKMFPANGEKIPKIRFKGFKGEWEEKKLGDVLSIKSGMSQKDIEVSDGIYPILATGGEIGRTNTALYDKESVLIGRKGTIDKPYYMNTPFWTVDTLFYSELKDNVDGKFLYFLFQRIEWRKLDTSTGVPSLTSTIIHEIQRYFPKKEEQTAIANFFRQLDETIALQSAEVEKLNQLKKGLLAAMLV